MHDDFNEFAFDFMEGVKKSHQEICKFLEKIESLFFDASDYDRSHKGQGEVYKSLVLFFKKIRWWSAMWYRILYKSFCLFFFLFFRKNNKSTIPPVKYWGYKCSR